MSVLADLATYLRTKSGVTDLLATADTHKIIRDGRLREGDGFPAIVLQSVSYQPNYSLTNQVDVNQETVQIDCYAERNPYDAKALDEQVRLVLSGYKGVMGNTSCRGAFIRSSRDLTTKPTDASDDWRPRVSRDYEIFYTQAIPSWS